MFVRTLFVATLLLCFSGLSAAATGYADPVHGARGIVYGEYQLHVASDPVPGEANAAVRLDLTLADPNGATVTDLDPAVAPELAIVRQGLDVFTLMRPSMGAGGVFTMNLTFPVPGTYFVYLGLTPLGGRAVTAMAELQIAGAAPAPLPLEVHVPGRVASENLGADITVEKTPTGHRIDLGLIQPDGSPLTDVDMASGDLVILSADGKEYFHARPAQAENATSAAFEAAFPRPGLYKAWALFQGAGKALELPFALEITD